ncbi:aryl-sulfate sulfotransferase [Mucilaginibacter sp. FT3.2]|uniref:aryl-sulfate sulfotransferase n=1 Tax=Mucilaginibacter sp. FT3.2 TaxID=2723090 RepID=UPI00160E1503|nr:aryl-sulfate sulfotransferase [Mucilaginibacter sp. FT3.2]MBB6229809.1 outer membrane protein assembly factor BamB [Mucilaginibacter sp. FT3.2]
MRKIYKIIIGCVAALGLLLFLLLQNDLVSSYIYPIKIKSIQLINLPDNRLRFKVRVTANKKCSMYLKYWIRNSNDTLYSDLSTDSVTHTLNVMCTVAKTNYTFVVMAGNGADTTSSNPHQFATQSIYQATPYFDLQSIDPSIEKEMKGKYFLTQILTQPGSMVIINYKGDIVWYQPFKKGVKVTNWTPHHTILSIVGAEKIPSSGGDEIVETNLAGKEVLHWRVGKGEMDKLVHHELRYDNDNNIYALTFDKRVWDLTKVGGLAKDTVHADGIVVFNRLGHKLWEWSVLDHLDPLKDPLILKHKKDWVHANSLFKDKDGNFLISYRDLNQVWKVEYKTGKVLWKFGEGGDFPLQKNEYFASQHAVHINAKGQLMMLDNGTKTGITRAITFDMNEAAKTAKSTLIVTLPHDYYTTAKGDAHLFDGDKILFCLTDPRSFLVTDKGGKILWDIKVGGDPYRLEEAPGFLMPKPVMK